MEHPEVFVSLNGPGIAYGSLQGQKTRVPLSQRFTLLDTVQYLLFRFWRAERIVAVQSVSMGHSIIVLSSTGFREGMWKRLPAGAVKCLEQLRKTIERVVFGKQLNMKEHQCSGCISAPKLPSPNQEVSFKSCPGSCAQYRNPEPREPDLRL